MSRATCSFISSRSVLLLSTHTHTEVTHTFLTLAAMLTHNGVYIKVDKVIQITYVTCRLCLLKEWKKASLCVPFF